MDKRVVLFALLPISVSASNTPLVNPGPVVEQIDSISGQTLPGINAIVRSASGFIWLASNDGFSLKKFQHDKNGLHSLPQNGTIFIEVNSNTNTLTITCKDTGISADNQ
jgi:hypothetical protein